jgi:GNAT superfamily N-acetyltransferase
MGLLESLVAGLPRAHYTSIRLDSRCATWLPFYWAGFQQTTLYTYVLPDLSNLDSVYAGFAHMKRKNIKRAQAALSVAEDLDAEHFYAFHAACLARQGQRISYPRELLKRVVDAARAADAGKTWYAVDASGRMHAAIFVVWDAKAAYYLVSAIDPEHRNSGAATLLVWRAIQHLAPRTREFNFEGSMIRGVEHSFRKFGGVQVPYSRVTRAGSWLAGQAVAWRQRGVRASRTTEEGGGEG